jgi:hypothetical protein
VSARAALLVGCAALAATRPERLLAADLLASASAFDTIELVIIDGRVVPRSDLAAR